MSLKSFDDFCARIVNNDPIQQKDIFDERQKLVRSRITVRALWAFAFLTGVNLLIMECGPQWCESYVLSTAIFGAAANLYWVIANVRRNTLFGINGTISCTTQATLFFGDGLLIPFILFNNDDVDISNFFFRNGMVSEYFAAVIAGLLLVTAGAIMMSAVYHYKKSTRNNYHS